ncbi:MAG: carboxylesterase family protein [Gammaproteobacteria bacterium]|nr:carboxylesterase family protein [Gammaproteobacteria bacterium]
MPDNAPVVTSRGDAVSRTTLSRTALAALACSALLIGCGQQPESGHSEQEPRSFAQVATVQGEVQGTAEDGLVEYKGIPYAAPPTGDLRWRAPQPALVRDTVLVADDYGNRCIQRPATEGFAMNDAFTQPQSEDCLNLNVYRPDNGDTGLPVMVWIPGGGLVAGSGSRPVNHGGNLSRLGVVVVAINYRLGSFGFFAHPELSAQDPDGGRLFNYGLMDQIAALEWVRDNIGAFGGDPENVTIFGESAGGYSVYALVASPAARGLFAKGISQSGYGRRGQPRVASLTGEGEASIEEMGVELAERLGTPEAGLDELRSQPAEKIVEATDFSNFIALATDGVVLVDDLWPVYDRGDAATVPLMIGATDSEFTMGPPEAQRAQLLRFMSEDVLDEMTPFYGNETQRDTYMYSDYVFHAQNRGVAVAHEKAGNAVYAYRFAMPGVDVEQRELNGETIYGAYHAGDLPYMFGNFTGDHYDPTEPDETQRMVSQQMMRYWTNFARTGDPNGEGLPEWPVAEYENMMYFTPDGVQSRKDSWTERLDALNEIAGM